MKSLNKIFIGAAVLFLLVGCNLSVSKISAQKYQEKIDKLEKHKYNEAVFELKSHVIGTGNLEYKTEIIDIKTKFTCQENAGYYSWIPEDESYRDYAQYIWCLYGTNVTYSYPGISQKGVETKTTYYSNLKVVSTTKGTSIWQVYTGSTSEPKIIEHTYDDKRTMTFDEYGWRLSFEILTNQSETINDGGEITNGTLKGSFKITVSYK